MNFHHYHDPGERS